MQSGAALVGLRSSRFSVGSNAMRYYVAEFKDGKPICVISGLGKNRGRWDADHSRSAAYRHARILRQENPGRVFRVISMSVK